MLTYQFRLRFFAKGDPISYPGDNQDSFELSIDGKTFNFRASRKEEDFWGGEWHVITCGGFSTEKEAWEAGSRCRNALYMLGVEMRRSLDLGKDKATSSMNDKMKESMANVAKEQGYDVQFYNNVHGLTVHPEAPIPQFLEISGYGITSSGLVKPLFNDVFEKNYRLDWQLNDRESLACALYSAAQTEVSVKAKFLLLVSVVESLIESEKRDKQTLEHVEYLIELTKQSELAQPAKASLLGSLKWLRNESINRMGKLLVKQHLGEKEYEGKRAPQFFRDCYSIRSNLLHTGKSSVEENMLPTVVSNLNSLVQDLLESISQKSSADEA